MKRLWNYLIWAGFCFLLGFSYEYHLPKIETWLIVKIEEFSRHSLPARVLPAAVKLQFFPPGIRIEGLRALPKPDLAKSLAPLKAGAITVDVNPLSLLIGDYRIIRVTIEYPEVTLLTVGDQLVDQSGTSKAVQLKDLLSYPIQSVLLKGGTIQVRSPQAEILLRSEQTGFRLDNRRDRLLFDLDFKKVMVKRTQKDSRPAEVTIRGAGSVSDKEINLRNLRLTQGDSFVSISGTSGGAPLQGEFKGIQAKARIALEIEDVLATLRSVNQAIQLPDVRGEINAEISFEQKENGGQTISTDLRTNLLKVNQFDIGKITGTINSDLERVFSDGIELQNRAGNARIEGIEVKLGDSVDVRATLKPQTLELRKLLGSLGIPEPNLELLISGDLPCQGTVKPEFKISCTGQIQGKDFWVKNPSDKTIVALDSFSLDGSVLVNTVGVYPKAKITIGSSVGEAEGEIDFQKGFAFKYKTDKLNTQDIKTLAGLRLDGATKIEGTVDGNSSTAKFGMGLKTTDFWFEDYGVGNASTQFDFLKGVLTFKNIEGMFNTTRYYASVTVDLNKNTISADAKLGFAEARDLQQAFSRRVQLPFEAYGNLQGRLSARGPLEFHKLSYDLESAIFRGTIGSEAFDEFRFNVNSQGGHVRATNISLRKGLGSANLTGTGSPNGQIDTIIKARGFRLEDLSLFNQNESTMSGQINLDMTMKGHVLSPDTQIKGDITQTTIAKEPVPDTQFQLSLTRSYFAGRTQFLNEKVWADFQIPFDDRTPFRLKGKASQWNFSPLFGLLTNQNTSKEFDTELTTEFDLKSQTGGFWTADGQIRFEKLRIRRGNLELHNPQPSVALFDKGRMTLKGFLLQGDNTFLKAESNGSRRDDLGISLNGKIEMSLLSFLTPFFSDMRGTLSTAIQLDGSAAEPRLVGSAFVDKGFIKLRELVHPFENIRADLLFNRQRIVINSLQTVFAGGNLFADGNLEIKGFRDVPVDVKGRFDKVNLLVPKDFNTRGSGDFKVSGNWFPFLLSGNYKVSSGLITRELTDQGDQAQVTRSALLPSSFQQQSFSPIRFDLQTAFPSGVFIRNALADTEVRGNLRIQGTPDQPSILGEIFTPPGGKLFFRDVPFEITNANVRFTDPLRLNPNMYAAASTRVRDYDVNFLLQGTRESYRINLRSSPPLPESDIISLLALGYTPEQLERVKSDQQVDQQSYELGGALLSNNPLGNEIKNKYGVNVRFGSAVDDATQTVAPKVTVSKQWSSKFNTSASRTVGNVVTQDVKAEYQLNRNVSVIGSWEGREFSEEQKSSEETTKNTDVLGLDLQYRMEFK